LPPGGPGVAALRAAHLGVLERMAAAARRAGRDPGSVTLVAVSKTVSAERLRAAVEAGLGVFGENRVQEAAAKVPQVPGASWHLVGPLQSNKVRRAVELFDVIETIDSTALARRLARLTPRPPSVLLQVNVDDDPGKAGFAPDDVDAALAEIASLPSLRVEGLMTVGRLVDDAELARPTFRTLRELSEGLRARHPGLGAALSMGMSDDFEVAIEEGATIVRVGRALFGERPPPG